MALDKKICLVLILILAIASGIYLGNVLKKNPDFFNIGSRCLTDNDCSWKITNCCPENSGAKWSCVNLKDYEEPECPPAVICPQVISPKPTKNCICGNGSCEKE